MMDRSVLSRQMFAAGGPVYMQEGGDPMAAGIASMTPPPMEEMPQVPEGVDPQMLEQMLTEASANMGDLENVDDYEQMMNMMRILRWEKSWNWESSTNLSAGLSI